MGYRSRGIRKYFSKPLKGCKTYGILKRWRRDKETSTSASIGSSTVVPTTYHDAASVEMQCFPRLAPDQAPSTSPIITDGFKGFDVPPSHDLYKKPLRVLSLFDGISTGYYTLHQKLCLDVEEYFSSEICPDALRVQKQNFPEHVTPLGSVRNLTNERIEELGRIDLLIGGSPCEELSLVNPRRKGILDPSGSGYLFFDYVRIMRHLEMKAKASGHEFFWLFENTNRMQTQDCNIINRALGCVPAVYNAAAYVPMKRTRYFWGNIPNLHEGSACTGNVPPLQDFLGPHRRALTKTLQTVTTRKHSQCAGKFPVIEDNVPSYLWPNELEVLFGLPEHFTDFQLSETRRQRLLGKGWSVHVIENILKPLISYYKNCNCHMH